MQLKKLELKGFKSFADKTTLDFNDGVTAVVGPNGSGKSNIIEAIRWVMGEQSAKNLRGGRMHDIIFSGTDSRKSINIAEVTLVLDNQDGFLPVDFEEVSVTRRINRNGESDYLLNKQPCRLKDIVDLFMDSGLGKESFSIISQGQVEAIFNSKAEDRRSIFEEAAGVLKYKLRKQTAERKLEDTQDNLDRVQDILYELDTQVEPLKAQSDLAHSFLEQKEELTGVDIGLTVLKIKQLQNSMETDQVLLDQLTQELTELTTAVDKDHQEAQKLKLRQIQLEQEREQIQNQLLQTVQSIERTESALNLHAEKEKHKEAFLDEKKASIRNLEQQLDTVTTSYDRVTKELAAFNKKAAEWSSRIKEKQAQKNRLEGNREEAIEDLRATYIDLMQEQTTLKNEQTYLERQIQQQTVSKEKVARNALKTTRELEELEAQVKSKSEHHAILKKEVDELLTAFQKTKATIEQLTPAIENKEARLNDTQSKLQHAIAKRTSLLEMQENYAGYFAGVKAVMKYRSRLEGIVGTVADLIEVPKPYLEAIDTVLSSSSQFVVVENEKAGRQAIQHLKATRAGRATFLPITTIQSRLIRSDVKQAASEIEGFVGIASDLIQYESHVSNILENLLGNTIVAETLDAANAIARTVNYRYRVVSLQGDMMNAGGSMTGGGGKRSSNSHLFSQKKELKELEIFIDETEKTVDLRRQELTRDKEQRKKLSNKIEEVRSAGEEKRVDERQLQNELNSVEEKRTRLSREQQALTYESNQAEKELTENQKRLEDIATSRKQIDEQMTSQKREMNELSAEREDIEAQKITLQEDLESLQEHLHTVNEQQAAIKAEVTHFKNQKEQLEENIQVLYADLKAYESGESLGSREELKKQLTDHRSKLEQLREEEHVLKKEANRIETEKTQVESRLTARQADKQELSDRKTKVEINLSRVDVSLDHLLNYLSEEYGLSYEEARLEPPLSLSEEEAQKKVKLLKKGIEELGPVNVGAIEEYERVFERFTFLSAQQKDLLEAKASLYDTMDQMDTEVSRRFEETFNLIKAQFAIVFPQMFGGGKAELRLTDPENLLTSGVEIVAQPPGKNLQSLSLLSGGERALTAISLLFAIIQVRPIPFCILDEAEAALDEANVSRFGKYLKNFSIDTQFIVITHRKGTMEEADSLYGVTMREKGVSKLVSVRMKDIEEIEGVSP
ncbi:chromosome segregation protein SMC [Marinilactibacillus sp. GCM10026970]|uniref:chromosome segregation protein SMC n=1 Tax=Marinilactibacillus sp. GCM10026970 TaxID=3252642 RepID=UPI00362218B6